MSIKEKDDETSSGLLFILSIMVMLSTSFVFSLDALNYTLIA